MNMFWVMLIKLALTVVVFGTALGVSRLVMRLPLPTWLKRTLVRPIGAAGHARVREGRRGPL